MIDAITRPALRYFGGKWKLADWIVPLLPDHKVYIESFGGGASILLRKRPGKIEVYNDLNSDVVNFFRVLRERPADLIQLLDLTPYSREEHTLCRTKTGDSLEDARRFYVLSAQGRAFSGHFGSKQSSWRKYAKISPGSGAHLLAQNWAVTDNLLAVADRLKRVQIENMDAIELIQQYDSPQALHYVDPPYETSTRTSWSYANDTSDDLQLKLAQTLNAIEGMAVLSGYRCSQYDEWYKDWTRFDKNVLTQASNQNTAKATATESIWLNPAATVKQQSLFAQSRLLP